MTNTYDIMQAGTSYPVMTYDKNMGYKQNICIELTQDLDEELDWDEYQLAEEDTEDFREQLERLQYYHNFTMDDVAKCKAYIHETDNSGMIVLVWA